MTDLLVYSVYVLTAALVIYYLVTRRKPTRVVESPPTIWLNHREYRLVKEGAHTITGGILRGDPGPTTFGLEWNELKEISKAEDPAKDRIRLDGDLSAIPVHRYDPVVRRTVYDQDAE